jgi:hypothetical protein
MREKNEENYSEEGGYLNFLEGLRQKDEYIPESASEF